MAKGNPFLGTVSGSFGDITLSTYRGKTVIKRKTAPRNPRTPKQIYQRMFFATISKSRTALKPIIDHSFEQIPHGVDSLNYFTKRNIALMREGTVYDYAKQTWVNPNMNFVAPKATSFPANPLRISEGSFNSTKMVEPFLVDLPQDKDFDFVTPETCVPWIDKNTDYDSERETSMESAIRKYEIEVGDFLTLLVLTAKKDDLSPSSAFPIFPHYIRYKCVGLPITRDGEEFIFHLFLATNVDGKNWEVPNLIDGTPNSSLNLVSSIDETAVVKLPYISLIDSQNFEGSFILKRGDGTVEYDSSFSPIVDETDVVVAATWIHSRSGEDGKILTSAQDLVLADPEGKRIPFNLDMETAFDLWTKASKPIGESQYLLEGGDV